MGDCRLGRQAALDQPRRGRRLHDSALAGAAGVFGTPRHQHAELRRHDVEPLGDILTDLMERPLAAGTGFILDVDDGFDAREMRRQRATVRAALSGRLLAFGGGLGFLLRGGARFRLFDLFEREQHLVFGKGLGASSKAMALHLLDDLHETIVARPLGEEHRLQFVRIVGKRLDRLRHRRRRPYFVPSFDALRRPDSLCRIIPTRPAPTSPSRSVAPPV